MGASGPLGGWLADLAFSVSQSDARVVGFGVAALATGALVAGWMAWRSFYKVRLIEDTPTSKARSAAQGYVELQGHARQLDGAPLVAPLSSLPCVWFRYKVEEQVTVHNSKGIAQNEWRTVDHGESIETFWLEDDTGRVVVDPEGGEITPAHKDVWRAGTFGASSPLRSDFVTRFMAQRAGANPHRFTEWRINPGETVYALGLLKNLGSHINPNSVEQDVSLLLREWKRDQPRLLKRFDLDKDGQIGEREWMLARAQARREVEKARAGERERYSEGLNLLGRTGDASRPFLLSAFPQKQIARRYRWRALGYGAGFFALGVVAVWLFNARFG
jgi:E3 Ubiquitin ligase